MAWIESKQRSDGGTSCSVRWRLGGTRAGRPQVETFSAGSDAQNLARAEGFKQMVDGAGQHWPEGWVKGAGFVRDRDPAGDEAAPLRSVEQVGLEYVEQLVDCSPGQRTRYRRQLHALKVIDVRRHRGRYRPFDTTIQSVTEDDVKAWLRDWNRALKTKANYHGLLWGVFNYALEKGEISQNPLRRTAPKRSKIRQSQPDLRFLTEKEFAIVAQVAGDECDLLHVTVGTGMRYGEVAALWVSDVDLRHRTIRINKAWKRDGDNGEQDVPAWLQKQLRGKHSMRGFHLGNPKTPKSRRTIKISRRLAEILKTLIAGRAMDDFVFVSPTGSPLRNSDYYERVWAPLMTAVGEKGVAPFRFHDLRHTYASWLIAGGVPLPHIQARLGHESITTTIDTYGHLLPAGDELIAEVIETALRGEEIRPAFAMSLTRNHKSDDEELDLNFAS